jgi:hypothetical protein
LAAPRLDEAVGDQHPSAGPQLAQGRDRRPQVDLSATQKRDDSGGASAPAAGWEDAEPEARTHQVEQHRDLEPSPAATRRTSPDCGGARRAVREVEPDNVGTGLERRETCSSALAGRAWRRSWRDFHRADEDS